MPETQDVTVVTADADLPGLLVIPAGARGIVVFAHGSGSSRFSARNREVAEALQAVGLATLLFDLLTEAEDEVDRYTREYRFDIPLISRRLTGAVDWVSRDSRLAGMKIGLFGASTGAAAALNAAAERPDRVSAVVSRGGRPDLATALERVRAPVLLIVGGLDGPVIGMNEAAAKKLAGVCELEIVPGATHLFEEPGKLEQVCELARGWFLGNL